ncbi:histidine kinase dimerization/phosphoacceptor domain -containing protein [Phenylobacterium sp. J367]|uniref:histidine kinase dimerization/phosphoacceptor domain -containing protein n=1 Tax=Phenylobacterium sp. J367 TaxID=2898435 RepID=UPI002150DC3A|nr:histidine kinase dimerization/phosphoacceptor domain -containing protein [Phenylobacterium sp. J367]MCR5877518.1 PAS domain-containing protein [Phenylobacterium sp. J367]
MDDLNAPSPAGLASDAPLAEAMRGAHLALVLTDARAGDHPIVFANDAFLNLTGYRREEVTGRNCRFLQGDGTDPETVAQIGAAVRDGRELRCEIVNYRKDGTSFWNQLSVVPVRTGADKTAYFLGAMQDVTAARTARDTERHDLFEDIHVHARELEAALAEKTSLLHEVDHRVKNNLQLISSLLLMQTRRTADEGTRRALRSMLERVGAIATVHRRLFQGGDVQRFDVADFLRDLAADLAASAKRDDLQIRLELEPVAVAAAQAAPFALVANELLSNAIRHAYPEGQAGAITVAVRPRADEFDLVVADAGQGLPPAEDRNGFGLTIVNLLTQQLRARLSLEDMQPGLRATVTLPMST